MTIEAALTETLSDLRAQADAAHDAPALLAVLAATATAATTLDAGRTLARTMCRELMRRALAEGVDHRALYGQPYSRETVLRMARAMGIPLKPGPRPGAPLGCPHT